MILVSQSVATVLEHKENPFKHRPHYNDFFHSLFKSFLSTEQPEAHLLEVWSLSPSVISLSEGRSCELPFVVNGFRYY